MHARFHFLFLVFLLFFPALLPGGGVFAAPVSGADPALLSPEDPYVVRDLKIDVRAQDAVQARDKAFAEALLKAYDALTEHFVPDPSQRAALRVPEAAELGEMVQDFSVHGEQMSATRYTGIYEIRFHPAQVDALFARMGVSVSVSAPSSLSASAVSPSGASTPALSVPVLDQVLVLPFYQAGNRALIWGNPNPWRAAWGRVPSRPGLPQLPLGDLEDLQAIDDGQALTFSADHLSSLLAHHQSQVVLVVLAIPDGDQGGAPAQYGATLRGISLLIYRASAELPKPAYLGTLSIAPQGVPSLEALYDRAVAEFLREMPRLLALPVESPVAITPPSLPSATPEMFSPAASLSGVQGFTTRFQTPGDWQAVRSRLEAADEVRGVKIVRLTTREAQVDVVYSGTLDDLIASLNRQGLKAAPAQFQISGSTLAPNGAVPVYELSVNPWDAAGSAARPAP